jgi:hypothetical protein
MDFIVTPKQQCKMSMNDFNRLWAKVISSGSEVFVLDSLTNHTVNQLQKDEILGPSDKCNLDRIILTNKKKECDCDIVTLMRTGCKC